ncbi:hypothetical protein [Flavobacterium ginsenosidimutans]|uniref:Uncharacterized protein n=1 Tax=Flavobacterium ginsenosidimutans TaxID=687844 RepID=A0ABZ2Q4B6_9FLAO|nr:hypothetical protein [Flavobacterium ginsenosidimutans]KAF2327875.1 hypothetical protein DM444_18910 [Flavobacterium ginsenosidimutans]
MQKKQVLVYDNNGVFLKMFKRRFKEEFDFFEESLLFENEKKEFDHIVYAIHDRKELLNFLSQEKNEPNVLVCLFNVQFFRSVSFLEVANNFILIDESKTRNEILKELNAFFRKKLDHKTENKPFIASKISKTKLQEYYKAMYFLM